MDEGGIVTPKRRLENNSQTDCFLQVRELKIQKTRKYKERPSGKSLERYMVGNQPHSEGESVRRS